MLAVSAEGRNLLNNQRAASEGISSRTAAISFQVPSRCWRMESLDISEALARRGDGAKLRLPYRRADSNIPPPAYFCKPKIAQRDGTAWLGM